MTTSLITGIAGFVGSHVAAHCLALGHEVVGLDDLSGGRSENVPDGAVLRVGSVTEASHVDALFALYKPDYVYHLAAYAAENLSHHIRRFNYTNNVVGSANVINAAINSGTVKRFVFASSAAVYGANAHDADENQAPSPIDPYGIAKYAIELDLLAAASKFGLPFTIFRPHNIFGPRQSLSDGYRNVIGIFIRQALTEQYLTVFGDGKQTREFTYIDDVAPFIANCVNVSAAQNHIFNTGSDASRSIDEVAIAVSRVVGQDQCNTKYLPLRHEALHVRLNHGKFRCVFGSPDRMPFNDALHRTVDWSRTQTLRDPVPFKGIEIEKGLPEAWRALP